MSDLDVEDCLQSVAQESAEGKRSWEPLLLGEEVANGWMLRADHSLHRSSEKTMYMNH